MYMPKNPTMAFTVKSDGLMNTLITNVTIVHVLHATEDMVNEEYKNHKNQLTALWDTGATASCIKPSAVKKIGLTEADIVSFSNVTGVNSITQRKPKYLVSNFILPNRVNIPNVHLIESEIASTADILIGMDIICMGDFSISNYDNKTLFSFSMPPHHNVIDLVDRANKINKH